MATETTYNVIKVQELRAVSSASGNDEIIINDVDSTPLETKKITVENFAYAIKDYVLPIASAEILGGIRVGQGLTINPANGVLRNDIYYINDLHDVLVTNPLPNQVLTYNGVHWTNYEFQGVTEVIAGDGLSGGGDNGSVIINVNPGDGLSIENDRVNVNTGIGLTTELDVVYVDANDSLTFQGNKLSVNPGTAIILDDAGVSVNYGRGLRLFGPYLEPYLGYGLEFAPGDQINVRLSSGLQFIDGDIAVHIGDGLKFVDNKVTADLGEGMEFVNGKIDVKGKGDLSITHGGDPLGSFNANQVNDSVIDVPKPGAGVITIQQNGVSLGSFNVNQNGNQTFNIIIPENLQSGIKAIVNARISISGGTPTPNQQPSASADAPRINSNKIYLHPYNGDEIGLYDHRDGEWYIASFGGVKTFSLSGLTANSNHDVYIYNSGSKTSPILNASFVRWSSNSNPPARSYQNGVPVRSNAPHHRLMGVVRTTSTGYTTQFLGGQIRASNAAANIPQLFVSNYYNLFDARLYFIFANNWRGNGESNWRLPYGYGANARLEYVLARESRMDHFYDFYSNGGTGYAAVGIDNTTSPPRDHFQAEMQGQNSSTTGFLMRTLDAGLHRNYYLWKRGDGGNIFQEHLSHGMTCLIKV
jgi:hypothetical protein